MENLIQNLILLSAGVVCVWAVGFFIVAFTSASSGAGAHDENRRVSSGGIHAALRGEIIEDDGVEESRSNYGLAVDLRENSLVPQGRLSEEATDEVIGVKV